MRTPLTILLSGTLLVCVTSTAYAVDLTGSYVGKWSCKAFDGAKFKVGNKAATMEITQTGSAIAVHIDSPSAPFGEFFYNGTVIEDTAKPEKGEAVFFQCGTSDLLLPDVESEMGVFGDPDFCVERLRALKREYGMDEFICYFNQGGIMDHALVRKSMTLFAKEVMPHCR